MSHTCSTFEAGPSSYIWFPFEPGHQENQPWTKVLCLWPWRRSFHFECELALPFDTWPVQTTSACFSPCAAWHIWNIHATKIKFLIRKHFTLSITKYEDNIEIKKRFLILFLCAYKHNKRRHEKQVMETLLTHFGEGFLSFPRTWCKETSVMGSYHQKDAFPSPLQVFEWGITLGSVD